VADGAALLERHLLRIGGGQLRAQGAVAVSEVVAASMQRAAIFMVTSSSRAISRDRKY
jgi:hypothetical protein